MQKSKCKMQNFLLSVFVSLLIILPFPTKTYAFWPFDLFTKTSQQGSQTKFPTVIQRIIDKFNLSSGEVEKVVNEVQEERVQEMRDRMAARLEEAVKAGVITSEQKQALLDKEVEWQQKQTQLMEERRQWMEQSGIDFEKLAPYRVGFGFGSRGFGRGHGFWKGF